jgi:hypothetical protein
VTCHGVVIGRDRPRTYEHVVVDDREDAEVDTGLDSHTCADLDVVVHDAASPAD